MANYYSPTVIPEIIPNAVMTKLELLLLSHMFDADSDGDGTYFHSWQGPSDLIWINRAELTMALDAARDSNSQVHFYVEEKLKSATSDDDTIALDMSGMSWEVILQDIVRRSVKLRYITVTTAFTCSKMRADGFGGMALFITADAIKACSTTEFLSDCRADIAGQEDG
ncbi:MULTISPECIES: hypothetical protein [unclassified Acidocella]|uniref:hypothetical protein n=1 Tax=unclassified Acidocella TaxID=2648610 RepID=UPI00028CAC9E|nr:MULTISPECIES: hypothetical protein [unclassified Acidocella]EKM99092.1 hypothetical protein MXAZACID_12243 [Acidocella sp. MX-AZ02]WBO57749.1 hypothetical protein GT370_10455 [Acidocella sp. MX-AZ03]